jgi:hypothetical protein
VAKTLSATDDRAPEGSAGERGGTSRAPRRLIGPEHVLRLRPEADVRSDPHQPEVIISSGIRPLCLTNLRPTAT